MSGAYGENVNNLMASTGARIHIPPQSALVDEITIAGEKEGVQIAKEKLLSMYTSMVSYPFLYSIGVFLKGFHEK